MFNFLIKLSNATFPIAWWYLIIGIISSLINFFTQKIKKRNAQLADELYPKVQAIKVKYADEEEQDKKLSELYKESGYNGIIPILLSIVSLLISILIIFPLIRVNRDALFNYYGDISFLWINDIFAKGAPLYLALLVAFINSINDFVRLFKSMNVKNAVNALISILISFLINIILAKILSSAMLIYSLGKSLTDVILNFKNTVAITKMTKEEFNTSDTFKNKDKKSIVEETKNLHSVLTEIVDNVVDNGLEKFDNKFNKNKKS